MKKQRPIVVIQEQEDWLHVEDLIQNTVVQVFAQIVQFDWLEPYKTGQEYEQRATGFFINDAGDIVTNAHVVHEAKRLWIQIPSVGRHNIHVDLIGFCPDRDVALLRIGEHDRALVVKQLGAIPFLNLGDSDQVRRTDKVLALGYALGQYHMKSTTGIVSGREFVEDLSLIQITAPVNPGNSGGPLLNVAGEVVGITIASVPDAANVGYAVPINELKFILDDLYRTKLVRKNSLGISFNIASDDCARFLGNPEPSGAIINKVYKNSLAAMNGIMPGDMLYLCNGNKVDAYAEVEVPWCSDRVPVQDLIGRCKNGDILALILYRDGVKMEFSFPFISTPLYPIRLMYPDFEEVLYEAIAGMIIMELTDNHLEILLDDVRHLARFDAIENKVDAVVIITHILSGSYAQQLRSLFAGDILKEINGVPVKTLQDVRAAIAKSTQSDFLSVKTEDDVFAVFPIDQILEDEIRLSKDYGYPISQTVINVGDIRNHGTEKKT